MKKMVNMDGIEGVGVFKTVIHLTDDKGWERVEEVPIDWCARKYRVHKRKSLCTNRYDKCNTFEFEWIRTAYEKVDAVFVKHMWFEMM